jgi:hypothetical protein
MAQTLKQIKVYLEIGKKKTFAGALDWPGWCRSGRDETSALQALFEYGKRYERVVGTAQLAFQPPTDITAFTIIERLHGDATTDFGAPGIAPSGDRQPVGDAELECLKSLLQACWQAFDSATLAAFGKELRMGPRGGGRDINGIIAHVLGADAGYLSQLGWKFKPGEEIASREAMNQTRQAILEALGPAARGELPSRGPRGGLRWTPRYFVRRSAWHVLDHAWEIEDRIT